MPLSEFDSFRSELPALAGALDQVKGKILRDEALRERFRTLFRSWTYSVQPSIRALVKNTRELFKLSAEIDRLAQLTSKNKPVTEYKKRTRRAIDLANAIILFLPAPQSLPSNLRQELFLPEIPDLPTAMVPERLTGFRTKMQEFLRKHPFDRSVFIMIRYRGRNKSLIAAIKHAIASVAIEGRPFFPLLAADHNLTDDLSNPVACLLCCFSGIAVFDQEEARETYNPNVAYELGMMHLLNRPCLILKHRSLTSLQTDILMRLYRPYAGPASAAGLVRTWEPLLSTEP